MKKVLIISHDKIGSKMAGPGIRYHYMAEILSSDFEVTVGFFDPSYLPDSSFRCQYQVKHIDAHSFERGFEGASTVIALYLTDAMIDYCNRNNIFMVFDLYAPVLVENLAQYVFGHRPISEAIDNEFKNSLLSYRKFFENGDLFIYSNQRQLDYWVGYVFGAGQIVPSQYKARPIYDRFIPAPMGIDSSITQPVSGEGAIKGKIKGIRSTDKVILWTGGVWDWFDAQTLIKAMSRLQRRRPEIKLFFFGTQHPNPSVPKMQELSKTRELAAKLNLLNKSVFFNDGWVPYQQRTDFLFGSDLAIYSHKPSIETEFSHRTRALDHIMAELPTVATSGDYFADEVIERHGLGVVCSPGDPEALAAAIEAALDPERYQAIKRNLMKARPSFDWGVTLKPLKDYLLSSPAKLAKTSGPVEVRRDSVLRGAAKKYLPRSLKRLIRRLMS